MTVVTVVIVMVVIMKVVPEGGQERYVARLKGAANQCDFQMVFGRLFIGLKDKHITSGILEEAATKEPTTGKLQLCHVKRLIQVKEKAKEEAAQLLNMENEVELNCVGGRDPGKVKGKLQTSGRDQPYVQGGGTTGDKPCGRCARQHGKEVQCPATRIACFHYKMIGHLKAAFRKTVEASSASTTESNSAVMSLNYIRQVSGNATLVYNTYKH